MTNLLTTPTCIQTDIPEVDKLLTEATVRMQAGEEHFQTAVMQETSGKPFSAEMLQALAQLQAAILCQQQAILYLLTDDVPSPDPDEVRTCQN